MKNVNKAAKVCCVICAILMLAVLILQYIPYWTYSEGSASIADYVWWPEHHKALTKEFRNIFGRDYEVQQIVLMPVTILVATILGVVVSVLNPGKLGTFIFSLITGAIGLYGFLTVAVFSLGAFYIVQIITSAALLVVAIVGGIFSILSIRIKRTPKQ